ncbi:MAG: DUF1501 domain-containing protein, partial [Candidatus Hydrogenedentota bacterium]
MHSAQEFINTTRREFLATAAGGIGGVALASLLKADGVLAGEKDVDVVNPLAPKRPPFDAKAKACIFIYLEGAPSQIDLFDPKPVLMKHHGEPLPQEMTDKVRFAFIQKESAVLMGSPRKFVKYGQSGIEMADL